MKKDKLTWIGVYIAALAAILFLTMSCNKYKIKRSGNIDTIYINDTVSIESDTLITKYVIEFLDDYTKHTSSKDNIEYHSNKFLGIYLDYLPPGKYGLTLYRQPELKNYSLITPLIKNNQNKLRLVVFHELGHIYLQNINHCHDKCDEIFSAYLNNDNFYNEWNKQKKIFFNREQH